MSSAADQPLPRHAIECVLFDLDGTLADTAPDLGGAANDLLMELDKPSLPLAAYRSECSKGSRGMLEVAFGLTPEHAEYAGLRERYLSLYAARLDRETSLFPGVEGLLDALEQQGIAWGIVTNKPMQYTQPVTQALGLASRAGCIIGGDSAARPKPAPDALLMAGNTLRISPERCIYVGDDPRDMQAGRAAGMRLAAAAWGYISRETDIHDWSADVLLDHPIELLIYLEHSHAR